MSRFLQEAPLYFPSGSIPRPENKPNSFSESFPFLGGNECHPLQGIYCTLHLFLRHYKKRTSKLSLNKFSLKSMKFPDTGSHLRLIFTQPHDLYIIDMIYRTD